MLDSTSAYKAAIKASQRYTDAIVAVSFAIEVPIPDTDPVQYESPFGTPSASTSLGGFPASQLSNGRIRVNPVVYTGATQQGGVDIPLLLQFPTEVKTPSTGWKSTQKSNASGTLASPVTIGVTYTGRTASAIWIVGTSTNYPVNFTISINGGAVTTITGNLRQIYTHKFTSVTVTSVSVVISKISAPLTEAHVIELGVPTRVYFDRNDIIEVGGTEESHADLGDSIGNVSANDAFVKFNNTSGIFDISSTFSPLSDIIRAEVQFRPFVGVEISDNNIEMMSMGSFTSKDWPVTLGTGEFTLHGMDYMETLRLTRFPYVSTTNDTTYLELSDYISAVASVLDIDVIKTFYREIPLVVAYSTADSIMKWLQDIVSAIPGVAYINRYNTLHIRELPFDSNVSRNPITQTLTDTDIIIATINPQQFGNVYSDLTIKVPLISPLYGVEVFYLDNILFTTEIVLDGLPLSSPIYYIESIEVRGATDITVSNIHYNTNTCNITLSSGSAAAQTVSLSIKACTLNIVSSYKEYNNAIALGKYSLNKDINSVYIQSEAVASTYSTEYFLALGDPTSNFEVETYWDPSIELCDAISVVSPAEGMNVSIAVTKQTWNWDGSLIATIEGRKLFTRG